jgi:hypothetical protein
VDLRALVKKHLPEWRVSCDLGDVEHDTYSGVLVRVERFNPERRRVQFKTVLVTENGCYPAKVDDMGYVHIKRYCGHREPLASEFCPDCESYTKL